MATVGPLVYGELVMVDDPPARPDLRQIARTVIETLEPLEPAARLRVLRAAAILLELDGVPFL